MANEDTTQVEGGEGGQDTEQAEAKAPALDLTEQPKRFALPKQGEDGKFVPGDKKPSRKERAEAGDREALTRATALEKQIATMRESESRRDREIAELRGHITATREHMTAGTRTAGPDPKELRKKALAALDQGGEGLTAHNEYLIQAAKMESRQELLAELEPRFGQFQQQQPQQELLQLKAMLGK